MPFSSVLFLQPGDGPRRDTAEPAFFTDLNLDQLLAAILAGRAEYDLRPFFRTPLREPGAVHYRHEVLRDLERTDIRQLIGTFADGMRTMRGRLAQSAKAHYLHERQRWFLAAVDGYCRGVTTLIDSLHAVSPDSRGLRGLRDYLTGYTGSPGFTALASATADRRDDLAAVQYSINIKGNRVRVSRYDGEPDYSQEVERTFAKFRQEAVTDHRSTFEEQPGLNHVEAQILDRVARLYPETFQALGDYCATHERYQDEVITRFDREIQFYLAYLEFTGRLRARGLAFCYPEVSSQDKETRASGAFDAALAAQAEPGTTIVRNDFHLSGPERLLVVTGPNQGGKTTFARTFGQLHYLASLGCTVPARQARLSLPDQIFTHFERAEDISTLQGKLKDELTRVHDILDRATVSSIVIMNETFTSTTLADALVLGAEVMRRLIEADLLGVYVTFADELATLNEATVSMVATVPAGDPAGRTYQIVRKPADGRAYAAAIAQKYGLTFTQVKERITA